MASRLGTRNKAVRFYPARWREAAAGLSRIERDLFFEVACHNWHKREPMNAVRVGWLMSPEELTSMVEKNLLFAKAGGYVSALVATMKPQKWDPPADWPEVRQRIFKRDNYTCRYCGKRGGKLECDHVVPRVQRGGHEDSNLATACQPCNRKKLGRTPEQMGWA